MLENVGEEDLIRATLLQRVGRRFKVVDEIHPRQGNGVNTERVRNFPGAAPEVEDHRLPSSPPGFEVGPEVDDVIAMGSSNARSNRVPFRSSRVSAMIDASVTLGLNRPK